jgi:hypothetical protein
MEMDGEERRSVKKEETKNSVKKPLKAVQSGSALRCAPHY